MKRFGILILSVLLLMLWGCGGPQPEETSIPATVEPENGAASNVDELLAAIAPGAEILLEAGEYNLCDASDYGEKTESPYYSWIETYDGYELRLQGVEDLTLRGSGKEGTVLSTEPRYSNVLVLMNCSGVTVEDLTLGHTVAPGECAGGVVAVQGCWDVALNRVGLYGCGINGLRAQMSSDIALVDSDVYDCSSSGIIAEDVDGLKVENCRLYDLGEEKYGGYTVFELNRSTNVEITGCEIADNLVHTLLTGYPCDSTVLRGNTITGNRIRSAAFDMYGMGLTLDGNVFEENILRSWYGDGIGCAVDAQGNAITEEMLDEAHVVTQTQTNTPRQEVRVTTVDEFIAAIAPNTEIILEGDRFDFSTATGYGITNGDYYYWEDIFDGPGLVICGVENFGISSADGAVKGHTLEAVPRYANVLTFSQCSNISLTGFTAGHTVEPGSCTGGVLCFRDSDDIQVENCSLYGCGILGVQAEYCGDITVAKCEIYECSYGGIQMQDVDGVTIQGCTFRDLGGDRIMLNSCKNITIDGKAMEGPVFIP